MFGKFGNESSNQNQTCEPLRRGTAAETSPPRSFELLEDRTTPATVTSLADSGAGTLRDALDNTSDTQIDFAITGDIYLSSQLTINRSLTITGPGSANLTIDGLDSSRIFEITATGAVTISGLTLDSGHAAMDDGGAIHWSAQAGDSLTIAESIITGSFSDERGGAIFMYSYSDDVALSILSSTLSYNEAGYGPGGAIYFGGDLSISNSTITGNNAEYAGGGIALMFGVATIEGSSITDNFTQGLDADGGGMFSCGDADVTIRNSSISGNFTSGDLSEGGGLHIDCGTLTLESSNVTGNYSVGYSSEGGGVYLGLLDAVIRDSQIDGNYSLGLESVGGGIFFYGGTLTIEESTISGNRTLAGSSYGAGLFMYGGVANITSSALDSNYTYALGSRGGAVYLYGGWLNIVESTVSNNRTQAMDSAGGAIAVGGGQLAIVRSTVSGNFTMAGQSYGGAFAIGGGTVVIDSSTISGNQTQASFSSGGAIATYDGYLRIFNSTISGNSALGANAAGGALYLTDGIIRIESSTISGNTAALGTGGGIYTAYPTPTIYNSIIGGNTANTDDDVYGTFDVDFSLIQSPGSATINEITPGSNLLNVDPMLAPLADNGGPTQTHSLQAASPARNTGNAALLPPGTLYDQRGEGFDRVIDGALDMGAYEFGPNVSQLNAPNVTDADRHETEYDFTITFVDVAGIDVDSIIGNDSAARVTGPNGFSQLARFVSIDDPTDGSPRTAVFRITPPGGDWDASDNGSYTIAIEPNQIFDTGGAAVNAGLLGGFDASLTLNHDCTATLIDGNLNIQCDDGNDVVTLFSVGDSGNLVQVFFGGEDAGTFDVPGRIFVATGGGNDRLVFGNAVRVRVSFDGGEGSDTLDFSPVAQQVTVVISSDPGAPSDFVSVENIVTGPADDTFVFVELQSGSIDGGGGVNTLDFSRLDMAIEIELSAGQFGDLTFTNIQRVILPLFQPSSVTDMSAIGEVTGGFFATGDSSFQSAGSSSDSTSEYSDESYDRRFAGSGETVVGNAEQPPAETEETTESSEQVAQAPQEEDDFLDKVLDYLFWGAL